MSDKDVDAQFADIVAHWDETATAPEAQAPGPEASGREASGREASGREASGRETSDRVVETPESPYAGGPGTAEAPASGASPVPGPAAFPADPGAGSQPTFEWEVWRGAGAHDDTDHAPDEIRDLDDDEEDEHFEPGPLAPLPPQEDLQFWGIIVGLVAGPLLLLWLVLFGRGVSDWWTFLALGLTAGGFVLLVLRQPASRDEDDPDNGARV